MSSDHTYAQVAQAMAEKAVFFGGTKAWDPMRMKLASFLAGAAPATEADHHGHRLDDWRNRLLSARAAGGASADATFLTELSGVLHTELRSRQGALEQLLETFPVLAEAAAASSEPGAGPQSRDTEAEFYYADVFVFVTDYLSTMLRRRVNGSSSTWCPRWWAHPEAGARLTALWLAWEHLRQEPGTGMSTWWLHHADPHLRVLMDPDMGPFAACSPKDGHTAYPFDPLPVEPYDPSQDPLA